MLSRFAALFCVTAVAASAQTTISKVIEVSVSRSVQLKAEEASFTVTVDTRTTVGLEEVIGALASLGITAQNFNNVATGYSYYDDDDRLTYDFNFTAPFDKLNDTLALLDARRRALSAERGMDFSYALNGVSATQTAADQATERLFPDLMADARRQAELMAAVAGVRVGAVAGLSQQRSGGIYLPLARVSTGSLATSLSLTVRFAIE